MKGRRVYVPDSYKVGLEDFEIGEESLRDTEVLLRTHYTLISPGTELAIYTALDKDVYRSDSWCHYPFNPGYISVGEVVKRGRIVPKLSEGDIVFCYANHASIARVDPTRTICLKVPEGPDEKRALFTRISTIAMTALRVSSAELGDNVAVMGLGLVGNMAAQLFTLAGMHVIGIDLIDRRLEIARGCGVKYTVNPRKANVRERILELTDGGGCEVTVEAIGNPTTIETCCQITKSLGEVILLGSPRGECDTNITEMLNYIHLWPRGCLTFKGGHEWRFPIHQMEGSKHSIERNTRIAFQLISEERLKVEDLITIKMPFTEARKAYKMLMESKDKVTGIILDWK
ncbi:MAG: zinc-binding alcohol dehydrogenase [Candidatus Bathyarchaeia archaeon]